ncbi:MAG: hypothetical protein JSR21_02725 [Proteobacteria bacterium]|nr:hypothetical protein [Pseudomonadota bacterium]
MLRDIVINAALPYATYLLLSRMGVPTVPALAAGSVFPIAAILIGWLRERRIPALGIIVLAATAASILGAVAFTSPYLALAKGSLITGTVGLAFGASLLAPRPLVFNLAATGRDAAERARMDALWQTEPRYRRIVRQITWAWTLGLLAEASLRLILIPLMPIEVFLPISEAMWIGFFALMMAWSWRYGRRRMAAFDRAPAPEIV